MRREKEPFEDDIFSVRERKPKLIKERESFESGVFLDEERRAKRRSQGKAHDEIKRKPEKQPTRERKTSDEPLRPKKDISSGKPKKISPQTVDKDTFSGKTEKSREKPDRKTEDKLPRHVDAANPVKKKAHPSNEPVNQSASSPKREKRPAAQDKRREGSPKRSSGIRKWLRRRSRHIRRVYHRVRRRIDFRLVLLSRKARIVWRRWRLTAGDLWTRASDGLGRLKRACESRLRALTASGAKKRRPTKLRNSRVERERETDVFSVGAPKKINSAEKGHSRTAKNAPRVKTGDLRSETPKALSADGSKKGKGDSRRSDVPQRENRNRKSSSKTRPKSHKRPPNVSCPRGKQPIKRPPRRRPTERESFVEKHLRSMIAMLLLAVTVMIMMVWSVSSVSGQRLFAQLGLGGASGYIILGDECMDSGNYGRAVEHYYKALTRRTEYESAIKLARAYRRTGDIEREVSALLLCIDQFEDNREPYERLKEIYPFPSTRPTAVKDALFKGVTIFSDITLAY